MISKGPDEANRRLHVEDAAAEVGKRDVLLGAHRAGGRAHHGARRRRLRVDRAGDRADRADGVAVARVAALRRITARVAVRPGACIARDRVVPATIGIADDRAAAARVGFAGDRAAIARRWAAVGQLQQPQPQRRRMLASRSRSGLLRELLGALAIDRRIAQRGSDERRDEEQAGSERAGPCVSEEKKRGPMQWLLRGLYTSAQPVARCADGSGLWGLSSPYGVGVCPVKRGQVTRRRHHLESICLHR